MKSLGKMGTFVCFYLAKIPNRDKVCSPVRTGATAEIVSIVSKKLSYKYDVKSVCIDDYNFKFCKGYRSCHTTAKCIQNDDVTLLMNEFE